MDKIWTLVSKHEPFLALYAIRVAKAYDMDMDRGTRFILQQVNRHKRAVRTVAPLN